MLQSCRIEGIFDSKKFLHCVARFIEMGKSNVIQDDTLFGSWMGLAYTVIEVSLDICDHVDCTWYFFRHTVLSTITSNMFSDYWRNTWNKFTMKDKKGSSYCRNSVRFEVLCCAPTALERFDHTLIVSWISQFCSIRLLLRRDTSAVSIDSLSLLADSSADSGCSKSISMSCWILALCEEVTHSDAEMPWRLGFGGNFRISNNFQITFEN